MTPHRTTTSRYDSAFSFALILGTLFAIALGGCATSGGAGGIGAIEDAHDPRYPSHWWDVVPRASAASWEILPQDCRKGEVILSKRHELGLLSNFAATPFLFHGRRYASLEGFWQSTKYPEPRVEGTPDPRATLPWPYSRDQVAAMTSFEAKKAGDLAEKIMAAHAIDWVSFEGHRMIYREPTRGPFYRLIREAMWAKVQANPRVRDVLLMTGDLILKPDHHQEAESPPAWRYFEIYMDFRSELSAAKPHATEVHMPE